MVDSNEGRGAGEMGSPLGGMPVGAGSPGAHAGVSVPGKRMKPAHMTRAKMAREARRSAQFAKFRNTELNLVPLVDTFVSIVFFALTTATVGELTAVAPGVLLPESSQGADAVQQITLGIGPNITLANQSLITTARAAAEQSNVPNQPLIIPSLLNALKVKADSIREADGGAEGSSVKTQLAIHGTKTMRYDLLARMMQTARWAGFSNISLQVQKTGAEGGESAPASTAVPTQAQR